METAEQKHTNNIPSFQAEVKKIVADSFPYDRLIIYCLEVQYTKDLQNE